MTSDDSDKRLRTKIERAFVPADLCATDPDAIEALLDAAKAEPFPEGKVSRMLGKLKGDIPLGEHEKEEESEDPVWTESELTEDEEALVALHRNGGAQLPPEIQEKLRRLREQAKSEPAEGETCDD
jgi:hypothetical protein